MHAWPVSREHEAQLADDVRGLVEAATFTFDGVKLRVTVSLGVASSDEREEPLELIKLADERLYAAKKAGRNRVVSKS